VQRYNLAVIPWAPLAQGVLAGRYKAFEPLPVDSRAARQPGTIYAERVSQLGIEAGAKFTQLAQRFGKTSAQFALAWCKDQPGITAPIVGPRTMEQLQELLPVLNITLTEEERAACDTINPPGSVVTNFHNSAAWMKMKI
jgi:aryl-alcohol dehydrogenase-like predicted oxidoreductase